MAIQYPDGHVLLRNLFKDYPVVSHGDGIYLYDRSGKRYLDGVGGAAVVSVGHAHPKVVEAVSAQCAKVGYVNGMQFTSEPVEELAALLAGYGKNIGLDRAMFLSSGSEAVEAACKLARQLWVVRGRNKKSRIIARSPSYHGNTLFALSLSGRPHYKKFFGPYLYACDPFLAPYEYRSAVSDYHAEGGAHYAEALEHALEKEGPDKVAAVILEPVLGSSAGASPPPQDYLSKVERICRKHEVLIIADEIFCGAGRTGRYFASEHYSFQPDILTMGKGLNGGYVPLSALMTRTEYIQEIKESGSSVMHAQTYMNHPLGCAAALAVNQVIREEGLIGKADTNGAYLLDRLKAELGEHPHVGHITGKGLMIGVEFVRDRDSKTPFDRAEKRAERLIARAFSEGLTLWPNVGQADGVNGDLIMLSPPLTITGEQCDELVVLLRDAIAHAFA